MQFLNLKFIFFVSLYFVKFGSSAPSSLTPQSDNEDAYLSVPEIITKYGYPVETHFATTEDGYILRLHRIPHGKTDKKKDKVVFLQHGLLASSADWIITGLNQSLAYILADQGYDVWMGNARGNTESRNHTKLNPNRSSAFWDFSWHEIGTLDLPTMIDYILDQTNQNDLYYIGHSQGTTSFYVLMSEKPEYNKKIIAQFSLAPIAYMNHMASPILHLIAFWDKPLAVLLPLIGLNEFAPSSVFIKLAGDLFCSEDSIAEVLCTNLLFLVAGYDSEEFNATLLPTIMGHTPAGASTKQLLHYAQEINSGQFRQYDYGIIQNPIKYGQLSPPPYWLDRVSAHVYLFYSEHDWLSSPTDIDRLASGLINVKGKYNIQHFNHLDYLIGIHAPQLCYEKILEIMESYDHKLS